MAWGAIPSAIRRMSISICLPGHDFHITPSKEEEAPRLGFSAGAFNLLNHVNGTSVDPVETSSSFGQVTAVAPPRRLQLGMRFEF